VTVDEAPTIGTKLALGHGVSSMIAMLEPELKALDRTASSSAMLRTMTQLGGRLSPFSANMAPIVVPSNVRQSTEASMGSSRANVPKLRATRTDDRPTAHEILVSPTQPHEAAWTHQVKVSPPSENLSSGYNLPRQDTPRSSQRAQLPTAISSTVLPATQRMAMPAPSKPKPVYAPASTPLQAPSSSSTLLSSPSANSMTEPSITPSISPKAPVTTQSSLKMTNPLQIMAAHVTKTHGSDVTSQTGVQQIMMDTMAPGPSLGLATNMPAASFAAPVDGSGTVPNTTAPSFLVNNAFAKPAASESASASSESQQVSSEPRQGVLVLDGAQLGRWVIDHLENSASRPGAMTTGIDPRMNATYPGAPTGT
jgi:hypothetical protein